MLISSLFMPVLINKFSEITVFKLGVTGLGLVLLLFPLNEIFALAAILQSLNGIFNLMYSVTRTTIIQKHGENQYLGRVFSTNSMFINIASVISLSTSGFLAEITSVRFVLIVAGLIVLLAGPYLYLI
ncbi:MFS transporter [Thermosediminibacter litoriperuensis]|uniref:MFS transporter n=2 Tax=Thermosediminibacter litoriperuensis TaxID=291989 RepID=A0A5S5AY11_9FIRM|nr:MFS transporter [Thermosediminibacter litoriperuensis]